MKKTNENDIENLGKAMAYYVDSLTLHKLSHNCFEYDRIQSQHLLIKSIRSLQMAKNHIDKVVNLFPEIKEAHNNLEKDLLEFKEQFFPSLS
jgi:hypothetical protein